MFSPDLALVYTKKAPLIFFRNSAACSCDTSRFAYSSAREPITNITASSWAFSFTSSTHPYSSFRLAARSTAKMKNTAAIPL